MKLELFATVTTRRNKMLVLSAWLLLAFVASSNTMEIAPIITKYGPASLFLKKGSTGYLNCTLSPLTSTATVKWTKDQVEINIANDPRFATNKFNDLIILNAQSGAQSSEGNYRCSATNSVNTTTNEYDLVVKVTVLEREFLYAPRDTFFYDIDGKRLAWTNCQPPIAVPLAKVTFINGSSGLAVTSQTDARVEIREISREGSPFYQLLIQDATKYDVGTWQCRAKNRIGTRSANFKVTFYGPPEGAKGMRVKEHRLNGFIMVWDFLRVDIDYYDITITKIATNKVQTFKLDDAENFDRQILEYQFYNLERGTEYDVQMRATSKEKQVGEWSEKLRVKTVTEIAPVVTEQPGNANIGEGQTYNMSCVVDASPAATFRWFKNGIVISPTDSRYTMIDNKLIILNALHGAENSEAKYKCEASNNLGKATSEEAQLTVQWMEQNFQIAPRNRLFYRGTSFIRISARAPIGSSLHVTWRQNGVPITPTTHPNFAVTQYRGPANNLYYALDIRNLDERVEGKYTVSASNLGGIRSVEFHMILAGNPPAINSLELRGQTHGQIVLQWTPPISSEKLRAFGDDYKYRKDAKSFAISYKDTTTNEEKIISTIGTFVDTVFLVRKHEINGIKTGVLYEYKIRMIDFGDQVGEWSTPFEHTIPSTLPPFVSKGPQTTYIVKENETLSIPCEVSSTPAATIAWYKDSVAISNTDARFKISTNKIELVNIQSHHDGEYYCKASNTFGVTESDKGKVFVQFLANDFIHYDPITPVYDIDGKRNVRILCRPPMSVPPAKVLWSNSSDSFLEGNRFIRDDNVMLDGVKYFALTITRATDFIGDEIGCAAYNEAFGFNDHHKLALTTLTLFGKPTWTKPIEYKWNPGPILSLSWIKERADIVSFIATIKHNTSPFGIVKVIPTSNTSIEISSLEDKPYRVEVIAVDGSGRRSDPALLDVNAFGGSFVQVTVDLLPTIGPFPEEANATLKCDFSGKPKPTITWLKDGINITIKNGSYEVSNDNREMKLININRNIHSGKYRCLGSNFHSQNVRSTLSTVSVKWFDDIFKYADTEKFFYNKDGYRSVKFTCSPPNSNPVISETERNVHWLKGSDSVRINGKKSTVKENGIIKDSIEFDAQLADVGIIACAYAHPAGVRIHNMTLSLLDGPLPPRALTLSIDRFNRVTLTWNEPEEAIDEYRINYGIKGTPGKHVTVQRDKKSYMISDFEEQKIYKISLWSAKEGKLSLPLTDEVLTVKKPDIPDKVTNVLVSNVKMRNATITWNLPSKIEGNNKIEYMLKVCKETACKSYGWMSERMVAVKELEPATIYAFEITARGDELVAGPKFESTFQTASKNDLLKLSNVRVSSKYWNAVKLDWDQSQNTDKIDKIILQSNATGTSKVELGPSETEYQFSNLNKGTTYLFIVYAVGKNGERGLSSEIVASTLALGKAGKATQVKFKQKKGLENSAVVIKWKLPHDDELRKNLPDALTYRVLYCYDNTNCKSDTTNAREIELLNLMSETSYNYTLTTIGDDGTDGESIQGRFKTHSNKPSKPQSIVKKRTSSTSIILSWSYPDVIAGTKEKEMKFLVKYCEQGEPTKCKNETVNQVSHTLTGIEASKGYFVSVTPISKNGELGEAIRFDVAPVAEGNEDGDSGLSGGVIAGIIIAIIVVIILLVVTYNVWQKRSKNTPKATQQNAKKMSTDREYEMQQYRQKQLQYQQQMYLQQQQQQQQYRRQQQQQQQLYRYAPNKQYRRNDYPIEMDGRY